VAEEFQNLRKKSLSIRIFFELAMGIFVGISSIIILYWRGNLWNFNGSNPISYSGDILFYANTVFNAQIGNVFIGSSLGGPTGQQIGLSAFGVFWIPMWIVGQLASPENGPWLAMFRWWLGTFSTRVECLRHSRQPCGEKQKRAH
jgi:hypothetical protein